MKLSIIIVSYNAKHHLQFCLESCVKAIENIEAEILVVDNNSPDEVVSYLTPLFPSVQFYGLKDNLGFAKANNFGVNKVKGEFILILNPDTIIPENLFDDLIEFHQSKANAGIVGVRLVDANGNFHPESKRNLPTPRNSFSKLFKIRDSKSNNYYKTNIDENQTAPVEILVGAFMFLTKAIYLEIGGFDSRYFMYGEDIDISYSSELAGYLNFYKGDQVVLHYKGESTNKDKKYFKIFFDAMNLFVEKYYMDNRVKLGLMKMGIFIKYQFYLLSHFKKKAFASKNNTKKNELYWLKESSELNRIEENKIVLSTEIFSFQDILEIIVQNNSSQNNFYIHSHLSDKIIGSEGLIL